MKLFLKIIFSVLLLNTGVITAQVLDKAEPPNWWIGMKDPHLQIMLTGKNIGNLIPRINYKGVKILKHSCPGSKSYLFIDLTIGKGTKPGNMHILLMNGKQEAVRFDYSLLLREPSSADRTGFNNSDAIYLITPDRFANGDSSNDDQEECLEKADRSNKNGRHGGDIEGMRQHLDYISGLGFTAIWPTPVLENNMPKYSYHGYAITDFYHVDKRMGSNDSYKSFCTAASQNGLKVIMDMIINHCGLEHPWMKDPPTPDWINHLQGEYVETTHRKTIQMDMHAAPEDHDVFTKGWFVHTMPDLNPLNPYLGLYLIQNSIWWIEYSGIAGIRMDTYVYPDESYMSEWSRRVMNEYPNFNITGEVWHLNAAVVSHWQKGKVNANGYVSYLPSLFDFPLQNALRNALMSEDRGDSGWAMLYEALAQDFQYPDPDNLVVFLDNHDMVRMYEQLDEDYSKLKLAMAYTLTTRGIPQFFYGDEILMTCPKQRDDGLLRADFPGGWKDDKVNGFTENGLSEQQRECKDFLQNILRWRKTASAVQHGTLTQYVPEKGIYVYFREDKNQKVMVVLNKNKEATQLTFDRFKRILGNKQGGRDIITQQKIDFQKPLELNGMNPFIIEIDL